MVGSGGRVRLGGRVGWVDKLGVGAIRSDRYRALVRDMQKLFFIFLFLFKKAFACPLPLGRGV